MRYNPPPISSPAWTQRTKRMVALIAAGALALVVLRLSETLPIVGVAVILAYLLTPLVNGIEAQMKRWLKWSNRGLASLLALVIVVTIIVVLILVVLPVLVNQFEEFGRIIPRLLTTLSRNLERTLNDPLTFNGEPILIDGQPFIPLERLRDVLGASESDEVIRLQDLNLVDATQSFVNSLTGPAFNFVGGALTALINVVFLVVMMFFLLRDGAIFADRLVDITPSLYRSDIRRLLYELGQVWNAYLRGQLTLGVVMGFGVFIVASLLGLPNAPILGLISGLLEFVPNVGPSLAIFPAALLALFARSSTMPFLEGGTFALVVVIVWIAIQNIEAYIIAPRIVGNRLNLHPLAIILAIVAGASLAGALGVILAAPMVASARIFSLYIYGKLLDRDPFPTHRKPPPRPAPIIPALGRAQVKVRRWVQDRFGKKLTHDKQRLPTEQFESRSEDHVG